MDVRDLVVSRFCRKQQNQKNLMTINLGLEIEVQNKGNRQTTIGIKLLANLELNVTL